MAKKQTADSKQPTVKATISVADLRGQSLEELTETLRTVRADLTEARRALVAGELINPRLISMYRKTIARVQTLMIEKSREKSKGKEDK